jgi:hypothetical protein
LIRRRRKPPAERTSADAAKVIVATAVTAYVLVSWGQLNGGSFYVLPFAAFSTLPAVAAVAGFRGAAARRAGAATLVAISIWNHAIVGRSFIEDLPNLDLALGPLRPVARYDEMFGNFMTSAGAVPRPGAEPWPNRLFAEAILRASPRAVPRATHTCPHHFVDGQTLAHDAALLGYAIDWIPFFPPDPADRQGARAHARSLDFVVVHEGEFRIPLDPILAELRSLGRRAEVIAREDRTPFTRFALVAVSTPGSVHGFVGEEALAAPDVVRRSAAFDGGPKLAAFARRTTPEGAPLTVLFFDAASVSGADTVSVQWRRKGRVVARAEAVLRPRPAAAPDRKYAALTVEGTAAPSSRDAGDVRPVVVVLSSADGSPRPTGDGTTFPLD